MFISSSYWSDNVGLVASLVTIRELKRRNAPERFKEIGESLRQSINQAITAAGLSGSLAGLHTNPGLSLDLPDETLRPKVNTLFVQEMAKRGIHTYPSFKATLAHSEEDIQITAEAAGEAFKVIKSGLEAEDVDSLLEADIKKEPFRRLVR